MTQTAAAATALQTRLPIAGRQAMTRPQAFAVLVQQQQRATAIRYTGGQPHPLGGNYALYGPVIRIKTSIREGDPLFSAGMPTREFFVEPWEAPAVFGRLTEGEGREIYEIEARRGALHRRPDRPTWTLDGPNR